ncbi:transposase, partial [Bacillus thuringiensis]
FATPSYCYALKQYFEYLGEFDKNYMEITLQDLEVFVGWLRNPYNSHKITPFKEVKAKRTERTINLTITVVTAFYDYLYRNQELEADVRDRLMKEVFMEGRRRYKSFLHHVNAGKPVSKNILKLKEPV